MRQSFILRRPIDKRWCSFTENINYMHSDHPSKQAKIYKISSDGCIKLTSFELVSVSWDVPVVKIYMLSASGLHRNIKKPPLWTNTHKKKTFWSTLSWKIILKYTFKAEHFTTTVRDQVKLSEQKSGKNLGVRINHSC